MILKNKTILNIVIKLLYKIL